MINLMVLGLIFLAVLSTASFSFLSMTESTQGLIDAQTEKSQLGKIEILLNNALSPNQSSSIMMAPVGVNIANDYNGDSINDTPIHTIPSDLGHIGTNVWGKYYVYCPIGDRVVNTALLTSKNINLNWDSTDESQATYVARVIESKGRSYVAESDIILDSSLDGLNVAYALISPYRGNIEYPSCDQLTYDASDSTFSVPNGIAIVSTQEAILNETGHLSKVEKGQDTDSQDIIKHIGSWKTATTLSYKLNLPVKDYTASESVDFCLDNDTYRRQVIISGNYEGGSVTTINSSGNGISFCNVDVTIKDISLIDTPITLNNATLIVDDSAITTISSVNSKAVFSNTVIFNSVPSVVTIKAIDSELSFLSGAYTFNLNSDSPEQLTLENSQAFFDSSSVSVETSGAWVNNSSIISVGSLSSVAFKGTLLDVNTKADEIIKSYGNVSVDNSKINANINATNGISVNDGGSLTMRKSSIVYTKNSTAIIDNGASGFYGDSTTINSNKCWNGLAFSDASSDTTGASSSAGLYSQLNRSNWTCNP